MITAVRASKRIALGGILLICLVFICMLAVKDMNDKLGVMTASNAGYQKMTDSQADKIKILQSELDSLRASKVSELSSAKVEQERLQAQNDELKRKFNALSTQNKACQSRQDELLESKTKLESERDELKRLGGRQKQDADNLAVQLRDQIARISMERDSCQRQYEALYKLHQESADNVANLSNEKQRLQLQLNDATSSTKSSKQLQIQQQPLMPRQRSSSVQPVGLEEPHLSQHPSTSKGVAGAGSLANAAPVGAQPPINGSPEVVPLHHLMKEDVMEAPKRFENLDAQVDPVQQDHPGLQAPVYRDNRNVAFDEDDLEDTADGQIPVDYGDEKILPNNQRYDHANDLDYDFQADFIPRRQVVHHQVQQHQQQIQQPKVYYRPAGQQANQQKILIGNPYQQQGQQKLGKHNMIPQHHLAQPQFHYNRGL